jgi:hypothetical protein
VTVEGNLFYSDQTVEIRWGSATGPLLATATGSNFSTKVTIPSAPPGFGYIVATGSDPAGQVTSRAARDFEVLPPPRLSLRSQSGLADSPVIVDGSDFAEGPVKLHWGSEKGPLLGTATGPAFSTDIKIPQTSPGAYAVHAVGYDKEGHVVGRDSSPFEVTVASTQPPPPSPWPSPSLDAEGPALFSSALTDANRTRTVSRTGRFRLFCGRFEEFGVTGTCTATSFRAVTAKEGGRLLRLGTRSFRVEPGRPALVRFRLSKTNLRMLKAARRIRMRGSVLARDALGNTTQRTFRFTLQAP